jgi:histidinol-phosphatase
MTEGQDDLALALAMADAADSLTMPRFGAVDLNVDTKPDLTPVTDADRSVEEALRQILSADRQADAVVGEEYGGTTEFVGRQWVIDPIDGTKNFVRGVPVWASLIALLDAGVPVVGVVSAPALQRRWWPARGVRGGRSIGRQPFVFQPVGLGGAQGSLPFAHRRRVACAWLWRLLLVLPGG